MVSEGDWLIVSRWSLMNLIPSYLAEFSGLTPYLSLSVSAFQSPFCSVSLGVVVQSGSLMLSSCESIVCDCVVRPITDASFFLVAKYGIPSRWPSACCPSPRAIVSHVLISRKPEILRLIQLETPSLDFAAVVGPLGSIPTIDAWHLDVFRRDPTGGAGFGGLCRI